MPTGIPGFDQLLDGGLPRDRVTLVNGARTNHEPAIFVAFEEQADQLCADTSSNGRARRPGATEGRQ
jgi:hypothetical protein